MKRQMTKPPMAVPKASPVERALMMQGMSLVGQQPQAQQGLPMMQNQQRPPQLQAGMRKRFGGLGGLGGF